ncbi:MAG: serine/threonine protein kinase [Planctomycetes bacterium]|nr:serine/threonine protein kinase [Planctomycetota bacterium]
MTKLSHAALARLTELAATPVVPGDRYELLEEVGAGGMGTVYRAHDRLLQRDVAIKVVNDARDPAALVERLRREARTVAALEHPSIPPVHDLGELVDGRAYYVMRFVQGTTLARASSGSINASLRTFLRLCETVAHAHAKGVVHCDLKPENVMLGPLGELYVMDWGIAGSIDERGASTAAGTQGFMAPEQSEHSGPVDARADVYALGGILAFLATGRGPSRDGELDLAGVKRPLAAVIARAREHASADRYPSALELARDVAAYLDREPVAAYREPPLERAGRFLVKHQFFVWLVVAYIALRASMFFFYRS